MNIYKRRFINYWNGRGQTPVHPKRFSFTQNGINYNDVLDPVHTLGEYPFGLNDNYTLSGTNVESINSQEVFNMIDMNWNGAELTDLSDNSQTIRISTTTDLLNYLKTLNNNINNLSIS